jgi:branched-chain amino acid transport system substrate-binding protein
MRKVTVRESGRHGMIKRLFAGGVVALCVTGSAISLWPVSSGADTAQPTLDVYSSMPFRGPGDDAVAIVNGIKLALQQAGGRAGPWTIDYISLDSSTAAARRWDPGQCAANARRAASDPNAVYYIGEFNSGCSEVSIPILNEAGIPQVSPSNSYDGLTAAAPGTAPGEPERYYPTGTRTFLRIFPRDAVEAAALLTTLRQDACRRVAIVNDREAYGYGLAGEMELLKHHYHIRILSNTGTNGTSRSFRTYLRALQTQRADCFTFAGITENGAVRVIRAVAHALPRAKLYGVDGVCTSSFVDPAAGGIPATAARRFKCTSPVMPLKTYPRGSAFSAAYRGAFHVSNPNPYAIYGYEAMQLGLDTIAKLGSAAESRSAIVKALFMTRNRQSVIGTYSFDPNGDTTLRSYGLYRATGQSGKLVFVRNINPR